MIYIIILTINIHGYKMGEPLRSASKSEAQLGSSHEQGLERLGPIGHMCATPFHITSGYNQNH
ncbi:unnamed protein product [Spirodela intermedia]|uniref:Uncharacterized protein n=1 Tax=Spirodela intermedia TaxID=51605 RepID=A0ABN7E950_SPIIN|nr:unnamed protein product [Spirodela intermedia]